MAPIRFFTASALALGLALAGLPAQAQWNNQPYQLPSRGNGIGLSPAHKQIMLENKLGPRRSNPIMRDSGGYLLEVERRGNIALLRSQAAPFLVPGSRSGISLGIDGVSFGYGGYPTRAALASGGYAGAESVMLGWTTMVGSAAPSGYGGAYAGYSVIDSWVSQLDGLADG